MQKLNYPFNHPPLIQKPFTITEVLEAVRARTNKNYMPSSNNARQYNSTPEYVKCDNVEQFFVRTMDAHPSGYCQMADQHGYSRGPIYVVLHLVDWSIFIDLSNDRVVVVDRASGSAWHWLANSTDTMSIDRAEFAAQIDAL